MKGDGMIETHFLRADRLLEEEYDDGKRRVTMNEHYRAEKALLGEIWKNVLEEELISSREKREELTYELSLPPKLEMYDGSTLIPLTIIIESVTGDMIEVNLSYDSEKNLNKIHKISYISKITGNIHQNSIADVKIHSIIKGMSHLIPFTGLSRQSKYVLNKFIREMLMFCDSYIELEKNIESMEREYEKLHHNPHNLPQEMERNVLVYTPEYDIGFLIPEETIGEVMGGRIKNKEKVLCVEPEIAKMMYMVGRMDTLYGWVSKGELEKKAIHRYLVYKEKDLRPLLTEL